MTFALQPDEDLAAGLRRVVAEEAGDAASRLLAAQAGDEPVGPAVHAARKGVKKLRCVVRLLRPVLGEERRARTNDELRAAAALLGPARDAAVMVELLREVSGAEVPARSSGERRGGGGHVDVEPAVQAVRRRRDALEDVVRHGDGACSAARLRAVAAAVDHWPLDGDAEVLAAGVADGLARVSEQERRRRAAVLRLRAGSASDDGAHVLDEALHDWRKRVKDLWHASRLLAPRGPAGASTADLDALGDLLGADHDAAVLHDALALPPATDGLVAAVQTGLADPEDRRRVVQRLAARRREAAPGVDDAVRRLALPPPRRLADSWTSGLLGGH